MTIQPIPTWYAGCYFRSRLEARWAVFFDALGIPWQHEPEGFETPTGRYLPDFRLLFGLWIEVKGAEPTAFDLRRCAHVAEHLYREQGEALAILAGGIPRNPQPAFRSDRVGIPLHTRWLPMGRYGVVVDRPDQMWCPAPPAQLQSALTAARSARFEYGESGSQVIT